MIDPRSPFGEDVERRRDAALSELRERYAEELAAEVAAREAERERRALELEWEGVGL